LFQVLLGFGADINGTPEELSMAGVSLLGDAANKGDGHRIEFLLNHGADPRSHNGWRAPLQIAKERRFEGIIDIFANT
jgi:hypothetical protein